ncbi:MAG: hypothetical protein JWP89_6386 [Schlesneria sp.]|nr:hypothetical protein [Schlesneria sp.]
MGKRDLLGKAYWGLFRLQGNLRITAERIQ